jgi:hypothetical protein
VCAHQAAEKDNDNELYVRADGILDNLSKALTLDTKMWWQAKYHQIKSKFDQGKYEVAGNLLRDAERQTAPPLGSGGGLTEEFKVLKDEISRKTFTNGAAPPTPPPPPPTAKGPK